MGVPRTCELHLFRIKKLMNAMIYTINLYRTINIYHQLSHDTLLYASAIDTAPLIKPAHHMIN
jgi:hypothetical protein